MFATGTLLFPALRRPGGRRSPGAARGVSVEESVMAKVQKFVAKVEAHDRPVLKVTMEKTEKGTFKVKKEIVYVTKDNEKDILG